MAKTMTINELIERLTLIKNEFGDIKVFMSSDEEGNSFHTLFAKQPNDETFDSFEVSDATNQTADKPEKILILYPWEYTEELD